MMERLNDAWTKEREAGSRGNLMTEKWNSNRKKKMKKEKTNDVNSERKMKKVTDKMRKHRRGPKSEAGRNSCNTHGKQ